MKLVALPVFLIFFLVAALAMNFSSTVFLYLLLNFLIWVIIFWSYKPCKEELELWPPLLPSCGDANVNIKGENESNFENAESSCDVAGDTYVNIKGENGNNEKARDNSNGVDNDDEKHSCSDGCNEDDNSNGVDNDDEKHSCSDGCNEDDNSNGSAAEIGWQDVDEQFDENLKKRIDDFIAKVNYGWRKEMSRDI
ncbi:hypothetical protein SADUNF_Sadunf09G0112900 [Salix dunnii]|uniref:Uncharacterized protein n=1 Tax=Salix dunnii TaxID=1413687 RepID=A0A835JW22_9ROSI|nr:hypothetical protein SADUNF_Sadunf09G0112900 [Salix dunnii]